MGDRRLGFASFFIGLATGDAAIHILFSVKETDTTIRKVERAIMMDGGASVSMNSFIIEGSIYNTIKDIEDNFICQGLPPVGGQNALTHPRPTLKFDAFVVTHWDHDHYQGVLYFLLHDIIAQQKTPKPNQLSRAFYNPDNTPRSFFYAPWWKRKYNKKDGRSYNVVMSRFKTQYDNSRPFDAPFPQDARMSINISETGKAQWIDGLLSMRIGFEDLIGRNFFSRVDPLVCAQKRKSCQNLQALMDLYPKLYDREHQDGVDDLNLNATAPAFFCIASNRFVMNPVPLEVPDQSTDPKYTETNKSSICTVLAWKGSNQISLYSSGDVHGDLETAIADSLGYTEGGNDTVTILKLSHHGSQHSTPYSLWRRMKPLKAVAMAGVKQSHAHPRWEVLHDLQTWYFFGGGQGRFDGLYLTNWPSYIGNPLAKNTDNIKKMGMASAKPVYERAINGQTASGSLHWTFFMLRVSELVKQHGDGTWKLKEALSKLFDIVMQSVRDYLLSQLLDWELRHLRYLTKRDYVAIVMLTPTEDNIFEFKRYQDAEQAEFELALAKANTTHFKPRKKPKKNSVGTDQTMAYDRKYESITSWDMSIARENASINDDIEVISDGEDEFARAPSMVNYHYIVPEGDKDIPTDPHDRSIIPRKHPLFLTLWLFSTRHLVLNSIPDPATSPGASPGSVRVPLADQDALQWWLTEALLAGSQPDEKDSQLFLEASTWPPTDTMIYDLDLKIDFTFEDKTLIKFSCDTRDAPSALSVDRKTIDTMSLRIGNFAMGVTLTAPPTLTVGQVAKFINFPHSKAITVLQNLPVTALNPSSGARSALWFTSGIQYDTNIRLEFVLQDSATKTFSDWLSGSGINFIATKVTIIGRRQVLFQAGPPSNDDDKDLIKAEGQMTFCLDVNVEGYAFSMFVTFMSGSVTIRLQRDAPDQGESEFAKILRWAATSLGGKKSSEGKEYDGGTWSLCETWLNAGAELLSGVRPRVLQFSLGYDDQGNLKNIGGASLTLQVDLNAKKGGDGKNKVVVFASFGWNKTRSVWFNGYLWTANDLGENGFRQALPSWERYQNLLPSNPKETIDHVNLKELFGITALPEGIPTEITSLEFSIDKTSMSFEGSIACAYDEKKKPTVPRISLDNVWLRAKRIWANKANNTPASWNISFEFLVYLNVVDDENQKSSTDANASVSSSKTPPCELRGAVDYSSRTGAGDSSWTLVASVDGLTVSHLAQFWPAGEVRDSAMAMLSHILIEHLDLTYRFGKGDGEGGSSFNIGGKLLLGDIFLGLDFHCDSNGWEFGATLDIDTAGSEEILSDGSMTLTKILAEIIGKDSLPDIPGPDVTIEKPKNKDEALSFKCTLIKDTPDQNGKTNDILFSTFSIQVAAVSLTMVQWRVTTWPKTAPSKRVVKVALNDFGPVKAPLVGEIKAPFEELIYMWVSDKATASIAKTTVLADKVQPKAGITKKEFDVIDSRLTIPRDKLYFKSNSLDPTKIPPADFVIEAGSHFVATTKDTKGMVVAVLDYVFGRPKPESGGKNLTTLEETPNKEISKAPLKKSMGPLSIENIGLTFDMSDMKEKRLGIVLDATFSMGPIGLALVGFGLSVALGTSTKQNQHGLEYGEPNSDVVRLSGLTVSDPKVSLDGLLVAFEKPPITIAGGFARTKMDGSTFYAGGLIVGFKPWKLQAMGVYGEVKKASGQQRKMGHSHSLSGCSSYSIIELPDDDNQEDLDCLQFDDIGSQNDSDTFTMVFIILKVEGPLFSVGFADVSGLTAGFGVNSAIRLPSAESALDFPFTKPSSTPPASEGPLASLKAVLWPGAETVPWFTPREGSFWIAAGLKATAFTMISVDAVVVISLNPSIQLGIFGVAVIDIPSLESPAKVAHAELGIACVFDPVAGTFRFDAQLSPRSYVLHESCHLTGGLALYSWAETGDFVFTLGGYHQAYVRPTSYPNPPRLGIAWSFSDHIRISGEAYFAVTARMCMGGGKLNATLTAGPLIAWFDAFLDFLINFRPFKFAADGGLSVGVRFTMDLWLVTIHIKAEIGATLSVLGPPMAGTVHVNFWVFGFDIDFGDRDTALESARGTELKLGRFKELVLKTGGDAGKALPLPADWVDVEPEGRTMDDPTKPKTSESFLFNCMSGLIPNGENSAGSKTEDLHSWKQKMFGGVPIPENAWPVMGGELQFSISFAFAASSATLFDNRPTRVLPELTVPIPSENQKLYALPMRQRVELKSHITIQINQDKTHVLRFRIDDEDEERKEDRWLVKPIVKNVPKNLWGQYDPATDPALMGNAVASMLNAPTASGSMPLVMGLTFQPPLPMRSKDIIPKFNIVKDLLKRVQDDGFNWKGEDRKALDRWKPSKELDDGNNAWEKVTKRWHTEEAEKRAVDVVGLWSKRMGWSQEEGKVLVGKRPQALLNRFENMVPAAPMIAAGV